MNASRCQECRLSPVCLPSLPFPREEVFGLKKKRSECRVGRSEVDKRRKWKKWFTSSPTTGTKDGDRHKHQQKEKKIESNGTYHFDLDSAITFARLCEHVAPTLTEIP